VVLAGYKDKMQRLMRMDPGLDRRFPQRLHIADYQKAQLAEICRIKARRMFDRNFEDGPSANTAESAIEKLEENVQFTPFLLLGNSAESSLEQGWRRS